LNSYFWKCLLEMPTTDYQTLAPCGLVLTGGTANLIGLSDLGKSTLQIQTRKGQPSDSGIYGITDVLRDSAYATTTGLMANEKRRCFRRLCQLI